MLLLAVETTSRTGSLAVAQIESSSCDILSVRQWRKKSTHSEVITVELIEALKESRLELESLTHLAIDHGPGSFTGIRVGLNLIRTLAYAKNLPVAVVTSLEVLAYQNLKSQECKVIAIPAVQEFFYGASFHRSGSSLRTLKPCESLTRDNLDHLKASTNAESILFPADEPAATTIVQLVRENPAIHPFIGWKGVNPLYIRASEAEEKMRKGLLKPLT